MAERAPIVTIGGKGSSLSSSSLLSIANSTSLVKIDSSILDKLSPNAPLSSTAPLAQPDTNPSFLTLEQSRAALVVLLSKLVSSTKGIRPVLPNLIAETLNRENLDLGVLDWGSGLGFLESVLGLSGVGIEGFGVTDEELGVLGDLKNAVLGGICGLLDCSASALSRAADAVAALSCEALRADVSNAVNVVDSGDGSAAKDDAAVASDLKVLLLGSKLVGRVKADAVSEIPEVHGSFREVVRFVHSRTRVELNCGVRVGKWESVLKGGKALVTTFASLAQNLQFVGEGSLRRAKLICNSIDDARTRSWVLELFDKNFGSSGCFHGGLEMVSDPALFVNFLGETYKLLVRVRNVVAWEGALALFVLERIDGEKDKAVGGAVSKINGETLNVEKKGEKKKKKVVMGKGTAVLRQVIKDRLLKEGGESTDSFEEFNQLTLNFSSFFDPKNVELDEFLKQVKEIVESNETRRLPKIPKGTRDFSKEQMAIRERAFSIITQVFKRHGGSALDTPAFELRETLMGKYGEDSKLIYDLADQGGELCSLRYDLTVPFARHVAMNGITSFKRYQIDKVHRRDNPSKGRFREFYQCDFDIAGQFETMGPDFEVVKILTELLDELDIGDYEIKLNHRKLLDGMLEICGVSAEKFRTICSSIDKLDKQSFEEVKKEMVEEKGLTVEIADKIGNFVKKRGAPLSILSELRQEGSEFLNNSGSTLALKELEILFKALEKSKCIHRVVFDLSLARGLDYYTGMIFEAVFKGATQVGSIAAGGRYDNLIGMFGTKQVPAVGVSLGIERVFTIMEQLHQDKAIRATETQVLVGVLGDDLSLAAELVNELWSAKLKAEYIVNKRIMKLFDRATESRIPWMVLVGEKEQNEGIVKLRNMETKEEVVIQRNSLVEELQRRLRETLM
ncbi:hypothetical protein Scep_028586 [Stephania cephalantha]|uniref:Histidine--tRNA ligase, cytoplasmic n=1 Tax=Stephania cephalantha TaxID=152367 RepID=A0AAP0HJR1_9MAGN